MTAAEPALDPVIARESAYRGGTPPGGIRLPDFQLPSYRGASVHSRDLRGKVVPVTFLDTRCTTQCPIIAGILGETMRKLPAPARANTVAFAISVDPECDTSESVRRFLRRRHVLGTFDFLLGRRSSSAPSGAPSTCSPSPRPATQTSIPPTFASSTPAVSESRSCTWASTSRPGTSYTTSKGRSRRVRHRDRTDPTVRNIYLSRRTLGW